MQADLKHLRHSKEKTYGAIVTVFGALLWLVIVAAVVAPIYLTGTYSQSLIIVGEVAVIVLFLYIAKLFYRAYLFGHAVLITARQFPYLHERLKLGAEKLGLPDVPQAFLFNSNGLLNAFAARIAGKSMVLLTSALIDVETDEQVDFVIGHELGHHAAGHLSPWKNFLKWPGTFVPLLGAAYHRARELTADRIGAFVVEDLDAARGGLVMLACGSMRLNTVIDSNEFSTQEQMVPPVTGFLLHIFSGYPRLTRRVQEIEAYHSGGRQNRRNEPAGEFATA